MKMGKLRENIHHIRNVAYKQLDRLSWRRLPAFGAGLPEDLLRSNVEDAISRKQTEKLVRAIRQNAQVAFHVAELIGTDTNYTYTILKAAAEFEIDLTKAYGPLASALFDPDPNTSDNSALVFLFVAEYKGGLVPVVPSLIRAIFYATGRTASLSMTSLFQSVGKGTSGMSEAVVSEFSSFTSSREFILEAEKNSDAYQQFTKKFGEILEAAKVQSMGARK